MVITPHIWLRRGGGAPDQLQMAASVVEHAFFAWRYTSTRARTRMSAQTDPPQFLPAAWSGTCWGCALLAVPDMALEAMAAAAFFSRMAAGSMGAFAQTWAS